MEASTPLKMKDLEALTDVSREAIHFYLREGLLPEPSRPKRNVAHYSQEHVVRIRLIKRLQEEKFLPLGEIKKILDRAEGPLAPSANGLAAFELMVLALLNGDIPEPDQPVAAVAARAGMSVEDLNRLAEQGVIRIRSEGGARLLDFRDAGIVMQWGRLLALGYGDKSGYDATYLGRLAAMVRELADMEVSLFLENFDQDLNEESAALASRGIELSNEILVRLRTQALLRRLSEAAGDTGEEAAQP